MANAQSEQYIIKGTIRSQSTGEPVPTASVFFTPVNKGTISNSNGAYRLQLPSQKYTVTVSHLSYKTYIDTFLLNSDRTLDISLSDNSVGLNEVTVEFFRNTNVKQATSGMVTLKMKELKQLPVMMGEIDPMKTIQLTPGVSSGSEGNTGILVRGADPGQNLMLLDGAPVYNPSHLLGFVSVFNGDAVQSIDLIKSGMPAAFGGRVASVIEVKTNTGNPDSLIFGGGIGLIGSRLYAEGPLPLKNTTFFISARRSYFEIFTPLKNVISPSSAFYRISDYNYYDLNAKVSSKLSARSSLSLSFYSGRDRYNIHLKSNDYTDSYWRNTAASAVLNTKFGDNNLTHTLFFSNYAMHLSLRQPLYSFGLDNSLYTIGYRPQLSGPLGSFIRYNAGLELLTHQIESPQIRATITDQPIQFSKNSNFRTFETAAFAELDIRLSPLLTFVAGLRYAAYAHTGPYFEYQTVNEVPDTLRYGSGKKVASYQSPEPRVAIRYMLSESSSVKASYSRTAQYTHLASVPGLSMPTDLWIPSSSRVQPQQGDQFTLGYFRNFDQNRYESYVELYYKELNGCIDFKNGFLSSMLDKDMYVDLIDGHGKAFGADFYLKKNAGRLKGWIAYSLAWSYRKFDEVNDARWFKANNDRRHQLSVVSSYQLTSRWGVNAVFVLQSGTPISFPESVYVMGEEIIAYYTSRNNVQLPMYHRLDLSAVYKLTSHRFYESNLVFSVYNVYSRLNPYYVYFEATGDFEKYKIEIKTKQVSLFPILPSVSWNFIF